MDTGQGSSRPRLCRRSPGRRAGPRPDSGRDRRARRRRKLRGPSPHRTCRRSWAATTRPAGAMARVTPSTIRPDAVSWTSPAASPRPRWATAIRLSRPRSRDQADKLLHICNALGYLEPVGRLAGMLADVCPDPLDTVFFGNSGTEAVRGGPQARSPRHRAARHRRVRGAFHGRTSAPPSVTSSSINYRLGYEPLLPSVYLAPFPNVYRYFGDDEEAATAGAMVPSGPLLRA